MRILIAEDDVTSRTILTVLLTKLGHQVVATSNGLEAWHVMNSPDAPKVAILDWMMPKMEGIEVCRRIRSATNKPYTYIMMQTAKTDKQDIETGFSIGVDDYLTKPINGELLKHKLLVAERIINYETKLAEFASKMETLAIERGKQLAHADRLATLGVLTSGVAHEINNPATFISGNAQTLEMLWPDILKRLSLVTDSESEDRRLQLIIAEFPQMISGIKTGVERISRIVSGLKSYSRETKIKKQPFSIVAAIDLALEICHNRLKHNIGITRKHPEQLPEINGDIQQVEQVLINLLVNASDAMEKSADKKLSITVEQQDNLLQVIISDSGPGIPPEALEKIFNPFFTTKSEQKGTGLGLSISKGIIEEHGGTLTAVNNPAGGAQFVVTLPII